MNKTVADAIAAQIATLTRVVDEPVAPFGYGTDLSCADDLTEYVDEVDGGSRLALGHALYRRLITRRGTLIDDPDYGIDVPGMVNRGVTERELAGIGGVIRNELTKDDRVDDVTVVIKMPAPLHLEITIRVTPVDPALGDFSLTFAVKDGASMLQEIR